MEKPKLVFNLKSLIATSNQTSVATEDCYFPAYRILSSIVCHFYIENDAEILRAHYTQKVAEKGFKMAFMMNKLAMINSCEIILKK